MADHLFYVTACDNWWPHKQFIKGLAFDYLDFAVGQYPLLLTSNVYSHVGYKGAVKVGRKVHHWDMRCVTGTVFNKTPEKVALHIRIRMNKYKCHGANRLLSKGLFSVFFDVPKSDR